MTKMILKRHLQKNKKKGFTLIELIVVIVIIAIIAAIAVPALTRYIGSAEMRALQAQAHNVQLILQAEKTENYVQNFVTNTSPITYGSSGNSLWVGAPSDMTYEYILADNGIAIKATETLNHIVWSENTLTSFILYTDRYIVGYYNTIGFAVLDKTTPATGNPNAAFAASPTGEEAFRNYFKL